MGQPSASPSTTRPRGFRVRVRTLLVLVVCCASLLWAWRSFQEMSPTRHLLRQLRGSEPGERQQAVEQLGLLTVDEAPRVIPALIVALKDEDAHVRAAAARVLGVSLQVGTLARKGIPPEELESAAPALAEAIHDRDADVRKAVAGSVRLIGEMVRDPHPGEASERAASVTRSVVPTLLGALQDTKSGVVMAALDAVFTQGWKSETVRESVLAVRSRNDPAIRRLAVEVLGLYAFESPRALKAVFVSLDDTDLAVRRSASQVLRQRANAPPPGESIPTIVTLLSGDDQTTRSNLVDYLVREGPAASEVVPSLLAVARDPSNRGRYGAARALGVISPKSPETRELAKSLAAELKSDDPDKRLAAVTALGTFTWDIHVALPALRVAISDESPLVRDVAQWVVTGVGTPRANTLPPPPGRRMQAVKAD